MKKSAKAALLSGLVFPGLGQLYLKRYIKGLILIILVLIPTFLIIGIATQTAYRILNEELKYGTVDFGRLVELSENYSHGNDSYYYACLILIVCCWIYGIVDAMCYKEN